jgi:hypothetical protein
MNTGRTLFSQLMDGVPLPEFRRGGECSQGDYKGQRFSSLDQFLCLAFAPLASRERLRDIAAGLRVQQSQLYPSLSRGRVARATLAYANEPRDGRIFAGFAPGLIRTARELYRHEPWGIDFANPVYAFDSTTLGLCRARFPGAQFRRHQSAVKLHTLLDPRGNIPVQGYGTGGQVHDVNLLDHVLPEAGAFYLLDRGYGDFARLDRSPQRGAFFVTRARRNLQFYRRGSRPVAPSTGIRSEQTIRLLGPKTSGRYSRPLRRIPYFDAKKDLRLIFLSNHFPLPAAVLAQL